MIIFAGLDLTELFLRDILLPSPDGAGGPGRPSFLSHLQVVLLEVLHDGSGWVVDDALHPQVLPELAVVQVVVPLVH